MSDIARVVAKRELHGADDATKYWRWRPMSDRIEMVEQIRAEHHGWSDATEPRTERVYQVLPLSSR